MELKLSDILAKTKRDVVTSEPDATLRAAATTLCEHRIGALVVMEGGRLAGILSERDLMRQMAAGADPESVKVRDVMTRDLVVGLESDTLSYTMNVMTDRRIRHLPVMSGDRLAGMISIGDVVNAVRVEDEFEIRMLEDYIHRVYPE